MKTLEDQGAIISRPYKRGSCLFCQHARTNRINNSNTNNTISTVFLPSNTHKCPNYNTDIALLSEVIDSSEQFFEKQLQKITQMSPVKSTSKGKNSNTESEIN